MVVRRRPGVYTFAEFLELLPNDRKADLIDGVIYLAAPEEIDHNDLLSWLCALIGLFLDGAGLGRLMINRVAFRLSKTNSPEPDLAVVLKERRNIIKSGYVDGPPDVAIEIVSPESVDRDFELKRDLYERSGVREYWIIDAEDRRALFLWNDDARKGFVESELPDNMFRSRVLNGFWLDTPWLWQRPLPAVMPIAQKMLAG